ncbi:MAG: hypothetical protein ACI81G_001309 [Gammaproteobacteria bacterium]|jgi:hypothetical protein
MKYLLFVLALNVTPILMGQDMEVVKIELNQVKRGYYKNVIIDHDSIFIQVKDQLKEIDSELAKPITQSAWKSLMKEANLLNLDSIASLKSPTNHRAYDGATHSSISLFTNSNSFSHQFDDDTPNPYIDALWTCISRILDKK